ncbi:BTB POZ domain-containing adapter for CUL3-mediated RhoA degradation protein [Nesidiocoris tenuis]|nr:BTB POZ domain-containing adapter for CUL3-mediated RhoA degradation protein [Nesidiocoris tenuis]
MNDAKLEKRFWAETASTAVYLLNRSPAKKIRGSTPEEKWTEMQPRSKRSPAKPSTVPDFVLKEAPHQFLTPAADQLPNLDSDSSSENGQDEDPDSSGGSQLSDETLRPIPPISDDSGSGEFEETEDAVKTIELSSESDTAPPQLS